MAWYGTIHTFETKNYQQPKQALLQLVCYLKLDDIGHQNGVYPTQKII